MECLASEIEIVNLSNCIAHQFKVHYNSFLYNFRSNIITWIVKCVLEKSLTFSILGRGLIRSNDERAPRVDRRN